VSRNEPVRHALSEGLIDAAGFVGGAVLGWLLGRWLGIDFISEPGYGPRVLLAIALVGLGGGLGVRALRQLASHRAARRDNDPR